MQPQQQYQGAQAYTPQHQQHAPPSLQQQGGYPPQQYQHQHQQGYMPPQNQQGGHMPPPQHQQQMGNYPPQQQQPLQQPAATGTIAVYYLGSDCFDCCDCCGCCGCQPNRNDHRLQISIDGKARGSLDQGTSDEFTVTPGNHRIEITEPGIISLSGLLSAFGVGSAKKESGGGGTPIVVMAGQRVNMEMGWKRRGGSKFYPYLVRAPQK